MIITVVTAGMSTPSSTHLLGERLAKATADRLEASDQAVEVRTVEVRELASDLVNFLGTRVPSARLREAFDAVAQASGVIAVTPIWNASYSGLFKLFFDALEEGSLKGRPALLAATGGSARHSLAIDSALLPLFFYLKATVAPTAVFAATEDWGSDESGLDRRIERAGREFADLVAATPAPEASDEFAVVDFEQQLRG